VHCVIFGYGYMGKIRYTVLRDHPDVDRITVVDPAIDARSARLDGVHAARKSDLRWDDVDAAFVCTPNSVTADLCIESVHRCGRVFCEKPPGRNWAEFSQIAEAAASQPDAILMFGFNHRLHPSVRAIKALLTQDELGEVLFIKGTYGKSGGIRFRDNWRSDPRLAGGGILLDQGIHMLDLFEYFSGQLTVMHALLSDSFWRCGVEDNALVLLRSALGVPVFLHSSATLWKHSFNIEIGCRDGYLVASGLLSRTGSYGREQLVIGRRQFEDQALAVGNPREEIVHFDRDESWDTEVAEFLGAVKEGRAPTHGTVEDARRIMQLVRDIYAFQASQLEPSRGR
jgi:predicted dehydrogenase